MSVLSKIKFEISFLLIITLIVVSTFAVDFSIYNFFLDFEHGSNKEYLKKFFVDITNLGDSFWYFSITIAGVLLSIVLKKLPLVNFRIKINFFISSIAYLLSVGIITQIFKHIFGRARPNYVDLEKGVGFNFFTFDSNFHSFPSGHSSTIFMVCFILSSLFPKLKYFFFFLASVVALSRVVVGAHFITDIVAGGLLALIVFKTLNQLLYKKYNQFLFQEVFFKKNNLVYNFIICLLSLSVFLTTAPSLDLYTSGLFYYGNSQFFLQSYNFMSLFFREFLLPAILIYLLFAPFIAMYFNIDKLFLGHSFSIKEIALIWVSQALGILILVNLVLKNYWGRERPGDIIDFGGSGFFSPWYEPSNACNTNCSFVSGDASVGFSMIILYLITKNIVYFYVTLFCGASIGLIRIFAGGHFLSDVLFAGIFTISLNLILFYFYKKYND